LLRHPKDTSVDFNAIIEATLAFVREHRGLVEVTLFWLGFAESLVITSFFIPASAIFLAIAALHSAAGGDFIPMVIAGTLGAFLGDLVSYWIGWKYKDSLRNQWPFRRYPDLLPKARAFFERWGIVGVVLGKFVGPMRPMIPLVGGVCAMPWLAFVVASGVSSLIWSIVFLAPTFYGLKLWQPG
jgi:membrane protein DedA with SNARE-associated domain